MYIERPLFTHFLQQGINKCVICNGESSLLFTHDRRQMFINATHDISKAPQIIDHFAERQVKI